MNTNTNGTTRIAVALATMALLTSFTAANAGSPQHKLAVSYDQQTATYEIKVVGMASAGHLLTVQVSNKETGQLVTNADVSMQHWVWAGIKAVPQMQRVLVALDSDGHGNYICMREHLRPSEQVTFRAHIPGDVSGTWTTIALNN